MSSELLHITLSTHNFMVSRLTPRAKSVMLAFTRINVQYGLVRMPGGKFMNAAVKVFASSTADREEYRFHINQYNDFKEHLTRNYITDNLISVDVKEIPAGVESTIPTKENWILRDYQIPVVDYLTKPADFRSRFVDLQTGKGKGLCSIKAIEHIGKRVVVIVKSMYVEKWVTELLSITTLSIKDIMVVKGGAQLQALISLGLDGTLDSKIIIIGNKTIQNWIKLYEQHRDGILSLGYDCLPEDFFEAVGAGVRLIDEIHQDFHLNFKIDLFTNVEKSISLSATLLNNDPFLEKMYKIAYPPNERYIGPALDKYIVAKAVNYSLKLNTVLQTTEYGSFVYSHNAFERSILRNKEVKDRYFQLIWNTVEIGFINSYIKGEKCAIFCSSVDMCTAVTTYLKQKYPYLDVRRYVADDPFENVIDPDIRVTTILSGGTAVDIPNLKTTILTIAVDSIQANIQTLGRLRKLDKIKTQFFYLTCNDIPKHVDYSARKKKMLLERAESFQEINAPFLL